MGNVEGRKGRGREGRLKRKRESATKEELQFKDDKMKQQ